MKLKEYIKETVKEVRKVLKLKVLPQDYIIKKSIFWGAIVLLLFFFSLAVVDEGGFTQKVFMTCEAGQICENPLYNDSLPCDNYYCSFPTYSGEIGEPPSVYYSLFPVISVIIVLGALFLNHILYNKGYDFGGGF